MKCWICKSKYMPKELGHNVCAICSKKQRISFIIYGRLVSMKNSRRIIFHKGKPRLIKSKEALQFTRDFKKQVTSKIKLNITCLMRVIVRVYYDNHRPDLDTELIYDCLEKNGIIENDKLIHEKHSYKNYSKNNPRVEIEIERMEAEEIKNEIS